MSDQSPPTPTLRRTWPRWLLVASLALNLLVIGVVLGAFLRADGPSRPRDRGPESVGMVLMRELPKADRRALWAQIRELERPGQGKSRKDLAALAEALQAEPFPRAEISALLEAQARRRTEWLDALQGAWLERVAQMTPEARVAYARRLMSPARTGRHADD